ncbi:YXWGXW repeat-containing protein [Bacteroidales bacterium OttesenSCG-928-J19]|nr:YXWGXW repeat-containing protein [Bacteroidales bacterium OttesenSCG-928-J19]
MKTRITTLLSILMISAFSLTSQAQVSVSVSIYANIPLAPGVSLNISTPAIGCPGHDYIWVDGYYAWDYHYRAYVWIQGYWALAPLLRSLLGTGLLGTLPGRIPLD